MPQTTTFHQGPSPAELFSRGGVITNTSVFLEELVGSSLILAEDWEGLPTPVREDLTNCPTPDKALPLLVGHRLLTEYQAGRIESGKLSGLILGNYRVLDRVGAGGMGVVFLGEHVRMRRLVAIKVLPLSPDMDNSHLRRFIAEMRAVAKLQHPNIVTAIDDGEASFADPYTPSVHYFVMEYVPGRDLDEAVRADGPYGVAEACGLVYQVASALGEAHKHGLVHRDIKPSNIRVTPDGLAKLLDFGLVLQNYSRLTSPGTVLGTLDYLAPEQARDASSVDIRADIYALGGTLFWCLTGQAPFPRAGNMAALLVGRLTQQPPSARTCRPELPAKLDEVLARMMACDPQERYPTPHALMSALLGFLKSEARENVLIPPMVPRAEQGMASQEGANDLHRVLVVDDSPTLRQFCALALEEQGIPCDAVADGLQALEAVKARAYDLVLTDWMMPGMTGLELCRRLRDQPPCPNLKVILFSAEVTDDEVAQVLGAGADDYLNKQFSPVQLVARVKAALRLKVAQDRADLLNHHLLACNRQLEQSLTARDSDLVQVRNTLVLGLADLVCHRDVETIAHVMRLQRYCRHLAEEAAVLPSLSGQIDADFVQMLECCAPLHDIGKAGLPDHILAKVGQLEGEDRLMMQAHTLIGAETLQNVARRHGTALAFLQMAIDIARHHHERYDGKGYPDRLAGDAIPLAARIVAIGDVYDGLRCRRTYKPALTHSAALELMINGSEGQFDPVLLHCFERCASHFERVFRELPG